MSVFGREVPQFEYDFPAGDFQCQTTHKGQPADLYVKKLKDGEMAMVYVKQGGKVIQVDVRDQ